MTGRDGIKSTNISIRLGYANGIIIALIGTLFFIFPAVTVLMNIDSADIKNPEIPQFALELHCNLTPKYAKWARKRIASQKSASLSVNDISGTEWPLFGSAFYLWATENIQKEWEKNNSILPQAPNEYARPAIDAALDLVIDPNHASWVKVHWGEEYLTRENVFYRMLVIATITSHHRLTGERTHLEILRQQVESLSAELDNSKHGLLDDYPGECYPCDVLTAIACIKRADKILNTDHSDFINKAVRGFSQKLLDKRGLVPYMANPERGVADGCSRGCGNSYVSLFAPIIWPKQAKNWYELYEKYFWQENFTAAGFREFPNDLKGYDWYMDVDSGPVLAGYGFAACAFGVGAARINGRFDHAYTLTTEMLATSWPMPDGTLLGPRLLSNMSDAPYLGEAGILFTMTCMPADGVTVKKGGSIPLFVYIVISLYLIAGGIFIIAAFTKYRKLKSFPPIRFAKVQTLLWLALIAIAITALVFGNISFFAIPFLIAMCLPRCGKAN